MMRLGLWIYLAGCVFGFFVKDVKWTFLFLPIFGLGGSIVLTLPYAILIPLMPKEHIGQFTGLFSMTRGFANIVAPVVAGGIIDIFGHDFAPGRKYTVIWLVAGAMIAISLVFFRGAGHEKMVNV
jgi:MFS family permease